MDETRYKTFWRRFGASMVDPVVLAPAHLLLTLAGFAVLRPFTEQGWLVASYFVGFFTLGYFAYFQGRWGQTIGKMAMGVKVVNARDEGAITYRQAAIRELPNLLLSLISFFFIWQVWSTDPSDILRERPDGTLEWDGQFLVAALIVGSIQFVWLLAELLTMATNVRRRAIHDFLAGTVVVKTGYEGQVWPKAFSDKAPAVAPEKFSGEVPLAVQHAYEQGLLKVEDRPRSALPEPGSGVATVQAGFTHPMYVVGWRRFWGAVIDFMVYLVLWGICALVARDFMGDGFGQYLRIQALACLSYAAYDTICHANFGKTLGKAATNITVVDAATLGEITWRQAALRAISLWWTGAAMLAVESWISVASSIGPAPFFPDEAWLLPAFICMLVTPQRRALHDLIAGTTVIDSYYEWHAVQPVGTPVRASGW